MSEPRPLSGDEQQSLLLKKWLRKYGIWLAVLIVVVLALALGIHYGNQSKKHKAERASDFYQQLAAPVAGTPVPWAVVDELKNHYSNTPYAALAVLLRATEAVKQNNFRAALLDYQWVIDHAHWRPSKQIARLNAAKIELSQNHAAKALQWLSVVEDSAYQPMIDELQGDISRAQGDKKSADAFYQKAIDAFKATGISNPDLDLKWNSVHS